jgi:hypothetical protein
MPDFDDSLPEEETNHLIRKQLAEHALQHLTTNYREQLAHQPMLQQMARKWRENSRLDDEIMMKECKTVYQEILREQRKWLLAKNVTEERWDENIIHQHLLHLDLEEEKLRFL